VQLPALRGRFRYSARADIGDEAARQAFWLMLPRALGMGANQITFLVNTALASTLAVGAVVAYNVAFNVLQIPLGVIGLPLGIVLLPMLSRLLATGEEDAFGSTVVSALRLLLWAMLLVSAVGFVAREQVTELLFGWGFDQAALETTAMTLGVFLLGLPAHAMNVILARAFYSGKDTLTPVIVAVASVGVNVAVSLLTVQALGLAGLALGIVAGAWFEATTLTALLARRHAAVSAAPVVRAGSLSLVGAIAAGLVAAVVLGLMPVPEGLGRVVGLTLDLALASFAGLAVYLAWSRLLRLPELPRTVGLLRSALRAG
jgi:putative peptidoglycan lipid II flippase